MRPTLITFVLLAATTALAQTDKAQQELRAQAERLACPVGMTAQQQGSPAAIWTTSLEDQHRSPAELKTWHSGVHVDLNTQQRKQIKQAELTVYFLPLELRTLNIHRNSYPTYEASANFSLVAGKAASSQLDGDLLLGPVASVTHISLMHITYSDGTEWKPHNSDTCSIKPSLYMPVDAK